MLAGCEEEVVCSVIAPRGEEAGGTGGGEV